MSSDPAEKQTPGDEKPDGDASERERSTIEFPYMDLDDALAVAKAVHNTCGSGTCQHDQLAAALDLSANSSGFRSRLATGRLFGLIDSDRSGGVRLTELGEASVDPTRERAAKAKAFLNVPLYKEMHRIYLGKMLPQTPAAIERQMAELGVAQKQTGRARQAFERSAHAAGFFAMGRDRLIMPAGLDGGSTGGGQPDADKKSGAGGGGGGGGGVPDHLHLMVKGLLQKLPEPDTPWSLADQVKWLQTAAHMFGLLYQSDGRIKIEIEKENGG